MFRRFHHGHSAGLGFLLALSLYGHALVYTLLVLAFGIFLGRAWAWWALVADALKNKWHLSKRGGTTVVPHYSVPRPGTTRKP